MRHSKKLYFYSGKSVFSVEKTNCINFLFINRTIYPYFKIIRDTTSEKRYANYVKRWRHKLMFVNGFYNKRGNVNSINTGLSSATKLLYAQANNRTLYDRSLDYFNKHKYTTKIYTLNDLIRFRKEG